MVHAKKINHPAEVSKFHYPSGQETNHADGIGMIPLVNNILLHNKNGNSVVMVANMTKEDDIAT